MFDGIFYYSKRYGKLNATKLRQPLKTSLTALPTTTKLTFSCRSRRILQIMSMTNFLYLLSFLSKSALKVNSHAKLGMAPQKKLNGVPHSNQTWLVVNIWILFLFIPSHFSPRTHPSTKAPTFQDNRHHHGNNAFCRSQGQQKHAKVQCKSIKEQSGSIVCINSPNALSCSCMCHSTGTQLNLANIATL